MDMQLDTGEAVSLMSELSYKEFLAHFPLNKTSMQLITYSGERIPLLRSVDVPVQYEKQNVTLPLVIVKGERPPVLGRNWLEKITLDWPKMFSVEKAEVASDPAVKAVLRQHKDHYKPEPGGGNTEDLFAKLAGHHESNPSRARTVTCFLDDILVTASSKEEHIRKLDKVLTRLERFGLSQSSVEYLGHRIDFTLLTNW
ncbi:Transposon Tf2-9 polyprotein [Labeo rohita]|uniref:Transposon Tf2-9 polyprotein n=1 Tax=Labeo rohita TaxID=84645 RepID=A0ABQ8L4C5_LABRO|nr:Transposon Tf2-9 polyprotein [Labeo rohita]